MPDALVIWVIYDHPTDFPDGFIARRWEVHAASKGVPTATEDVVRAAHLEPLEEHMRDLGLISLPVHHDDDPTIVGTWL